MSFAVPANAYDQFMGRFSGPLAGQFTAWLRLAPGQRVLDVGCGPGALTAILVAKLGTDSVSAIDPSESFVTQRVSECPAWTCVAASPKRFPGPTRPLTVPRPSSWCT